MTKFQFPYRSSKESDITKCKACYFSQYKNFDYTILPSKTEIKLMDQIVISCKIFAQGCNEEFSIHTLLNIFFDPGMYTKNPIKTNFTRIKLLRHYNRILENY